jgi:hypothetical protein
MIFQSFEMRCRRCCGCLVIRFAGPPLHSGFPRGPQPIACLCAVTKAQQPLEILKLSAHGCLSGHRPMIRASGRARSVVAAIIPAPIPAGTPASTDQDFFFVVVFATRLLHQLGEMKQSPSKLKNLITRFLHRNKLSESLSVLKFTDGNPCRLNMLR